MMSKLFILCYTYFPQTFLPLQERSSYLEYQKLMREIQHLTRLYVAWLFVCAEETKLKSAENLKVMQDNITKMQASMAENESKVEELSAQIQELQKKKDQVHWKMRLLTLGGFLHFSDNPFSSNLVSS